MSSDSLGSELDMLRQSLKQKERELADKEIIITSLRQREEDTNQTIEELENNEQLMRQTIERLKKEIEEKDSELDAVSHALKEVEQSYETLNKRTEAKTAQLQQFAESLSKSKKELDETRDANKELLQRNEMLTNQVSELTVAMKRSARDHEQQINQLSQQIATSNMKAQESETRLKIASSMRFSIADEFGEIMESTSLLPGKRVASDRTMPEPRPVAPPTTVKSNISNNTTAMRTTLSADETRGADYSPTCVHRRKRPTANDRHPTIERSSTIEKSAAIENQAYDPIAEFKMRRARANELARRNMQTKPLHQTSYPLELDTFDTTDITEHEIKRGNIGHQLSRPPQRPPPPVPTHENASAPIRQSTRSRQALANCSNTPPVARRVYKKAEAFIV